MKNKGMHIGLAMLLCFMMVATVLPVEPVEGDGNHQGGWWEYTYGTDEDWGPYCTDARFRTDPTDDREMAMERIAVPWIKIGNSVVGLDSDDLNGAATYTITQGTSSSVTYGYLVDLDDDDVEEAVTVKFEFFYRDANEERVGDYDCEITVTLTDVGNSATGTIPIWVDGAPQGVTSGATDQLITKYATSSSWESTHTTEDDYEYSDTGNFYEQGSNDYRTKIWNANGAKDMELWFAYEEWDEVEGLTFYGINGYEQRNWAGGLTNFTDDYDAEPSTFQNDDDIYNQGSGRDISYWECLSFAVETGYSVTISAKMSIDIYYDGSAAP